MSNSKQGDSYSDIEINAKRYSIFIVNRENAKTLAINPSNWQQIRDAVDKRVEELK